jgi:hypothetical protein
MGVLILGMLWLNGPGLRWLGPRLAQHFLAKAGLSGGFRIEGSISSGFAIVDLNLAGAGSLASLSADRITPLYQWARLLHGQPDGLTIDGMHADLRLGINAPDPSPNPALDLAKLVQSIRAARGRIVPLQFDFNRLSISATRAGKSAFVLEPSRISHAAGSNVLAVASGKLTFPNGQSYPAQTTTLDWGADRLSVDRLDPLPDLGLRHLTLYLPATGDAALATLIRLDEAEMQLESTAGLSSAKLTLLSGSVDLSKWTKRFGIVLPATAMLSSLTLDVANLMPDPRAATGRVDLTLDALSWQGWLVPQALVSSTLENDRASLTVRATALGSPVLLDSALALTRVKHALVPGEVTGTIRIAKVAEVIRALAARVPAIRPDADVPASSLVGSFKLAIHDNKLQSAELDSTLTPEDPTLVSALASHARWQRGQPARADITLDGLKLTASYDTDSTAYAGTLALDEFTSTRITRWLAITGINPGGTAGLSGHWSGSGDLSNKKHRGELTLTHASWQQPEKMPITGSGSARYEWPDAIAVSGLTVQAGQQSVTLDAGHEAGLLTIHNCTWRDGETAIADASASLPLPQDLTHWRDTLVKDPRPVSVKLESRVLSLALLQPWLPKAAQPDPRATGQVHLDVSGTYAEPSVDASIECLNLRTAANPNLPPATLKLALKAGAGRLTLDGSVSTPDYAPALISAAMPFDPVAWAQNPQTIKQAPLTAKLDLPRLDLARFTPLLPVARQLAGMLTGNLVVTGQLGAPEVRGSLHLSRAGIVFTNPKFPAVQGASADVDLTTSAIVLKNLRGDTAGGRLTGNGVLTLNAGQPSSVDFHLRGDHLPVLRDDKLILRANADLHLLGPWAKATISGTLSVVDSLFFRDIELLPIGRPFTAPSAAALPRIDAPISRSVALPAPFDNWGLNLTLRTEEPFLIRGNLATGRVDGNLRVGGTLGQPRPDGLVTLSDFVAALPFSKLKVKTGVVRFTPATGFDPILEIRGSADLRPYRVDVYASGKLSDPQLFLTSNPPLPENEIMTLLATGTTSTQLENTQAASSRAIQLFAEEVRRGRVRYARQLRPLLGLLDNVDFSLNETDPYSSSTLSTATIHFSEHWLVSAGMGAEGNTRVLAIWRISFR